MSVDLGELRARLTADSREMRAELRAIREDLRGQSAEARAAAGSFDSLNNALGQLGLSADQIRRIQSNLRNTNPDILRRQLEAVREQLRLLGLDADQISEIEEHLNDTSEAAEGAATALGGVESVLIAIGGIVSLDKIADIIRVTTGEATKLQNSLKGLNSIATAFNQNVDDTNNAVQSLASDGLAPVSSYAAGLKSLLSTGLGLDQANELLETFKDRAAFGKSETVSFSQAVENLASSFKTESSELGDLSGMTENYSYILEVGAKTLGKKVTALTQAERAQAKYLGIMQVSQPFVGDAAKLTDSFSGRQAALNAKWVEAQQVLGEAYLPALDTIMEIVTPIITGFAKWASENKETVAGITAATAAIVGMTTVMVVLIPAIGQARVAFTALTLAIKTARDAATFGAALSALLGPIGLLVGGIALVAGGVWAYKTAADATTESIWKFADSQEELNQKLSESPLNRSVQDVKDLQTDIDTANKLLEERINLEEALEAAKDKNINAVGIAGTQKADKYISDLLKKIAELDSQLSVLGINTPDDAPKILDDLEKKSREALSAIVEIERSSMRETIAHADNVKEMKGLITEYDKLNGSAKLTEEQKSRLEQVVKALKKEYPDLINQLDEENVWHIKNIDSLKEYVNGEEDRVNAASKASIETITIAQTEAKERVRLARAAAQAIEDIESGKTKASLPSLGFINPSSGMDSWSNSIINKTKSEIQNVINDDNFAINKAKKLLEDLSTSNWDAFRTPVVSGTPEEKKKGKVKTLAEIQQEDYQQSLKYIEIKKALNQMSEAEELKKLEGLKKTYEKNADIRMDLEVKIYQLQDQMRQTSFKASNEWIEQEERRMTLAGESEEEITAMKLDAWVRVRSRYEKDSDLYKQADTQLYNAKVAQIKQVAKVELEAAKEREKLSKENTKKAIDAIEKAKKAELDIIDDSERLKERNELTAEMEKYRYATSEKGQKTFLELQEKLRKMDVEDQKRNLQDERDQKLEGLDKQKQDTETWYDDLKSAAEDFTGDLTNLYKLADDERLKSFITTNAKIKEEMVNLQAALAMGASPGGSASVISQMMANSGMWSSASADERRRLDAENERLGASIGATKNTNEGKWYKADGTPLYHTGGIAGEMNFRSGDMLMPDEIGAILKRGEPVLTTEQIGSLVGSGAQGKQVVNNYNGPLVEHSGDVILEDQADIRTYHKEQDEVARQLLAKGERA